MYHGNLQQVTRCAHQTAYTITVQVDRGITAKPEWRFGCQLCADCGVSCAFSSTIVRGFNCHHGGNEVVAVVHSYCGGQYFHVASCHSHLATMLSFND